MEAYVRSGMKLGNIILNAGVLKYPNRATEMYVSSWEVCKDEQSKMAC